MDTEMEDASAVARTLAGDAGAFRALVDRHGDRLYRFCRARLGNDADAEDAVQDVFVRAYRSLRRYDPNRSFSVWLFAIAANRVKSRYRLKARDAELTERATLQWLSGEGRRPVDEGPEERALGELAAEELRAAMGGLPARKRAVLELFYFAGLSVAETAAALGMGVEAVKSSLFRARRELSRTLADGEQPAKARKGTH